jgi:hypothetical protein
MILSKTVWLCFLLWVLQACQYVPLGTETTDLDHRAFVSLWRTYSHSRTSEDLDEVREDIRQLSEDLRGIARKVDAPSLLPEGIERLIAEPPSRLTVDPHAMVAACTLHAADVAQAGGKLDVASALYRSIIRTYSHKDYAPYMAKATAGLQTVGSLCPRRFTSTMAQRLSSA